MTQTVILISFFICHFLADYTHLSTDRMLSAKRFGKPLGPIFDHALVHAGLMGWMMVLWVTSGELPDSASMRERILLSFLLQLSSHFVINVTKGRMNGWFPSLQNPENRCHWYVFGLDQLLHVIVIIIMSEILTP